MTTETVSVNWPKQVALVMLKPLQDLKVVEVHERVAYSLSFSKEKILWESIQISPEEKPQKLVAANRVFKCPVWGAYYLPWVVARPLDGKMLPKGKLLVVLDGEEIVEGPLYAFLPDLGPLDCMESRSWKKPSSLCRAHAMRDDLSADADKQIGFMMVNLTKLEVRLSDVTTEEKMTLEIGILSAYYSTKKSEAAG